MMRTLWQEGESPFPAGRVRRMTYADAMERYGVDRPDLRYGLEIADVTEVFRAVEFPFTATAIAAGGRVRGIRIPGGASLSRKQFDEIDAVGKSAGVRGVLRVKSVGGVVEGAVGKAVGDGAASRLGLPDGELGLFVAGEDRITNPALDRIRQDVALRLQLVPEGVNEFVCAVDFPMFELDAVSGRLSAMHHPFPSPHPDDIERLKCQPWTARALSYYLVLNAPELAV